MKHPVLLMVFNRAAPTARVFERIRLAKPPRLYLAADGPRKDRPQDKLQCEETRRIVDAVDWKCDVRTLFRNENLGCKVSCAEAIDWFFDNEEAGVIFEDDDVPAFSFFQYCDELLDCYRHDQRVAHISGANPVCDTISTANSFYWGRTPFMWGWAGWRRSWRSYDLEMRSWPEWRDSGGLEKRANGNGSFVRYWKKIFDRTHSGEIDTYDYQWIYTCWQQDWLVAAPSINQIDNVGYGPGATHTTGSEPVWLKRCRAREMEFPLRHPPDFTVDRTFEEALNRTFFGISLFGEVKEALYRAPGLQPAVRLAKTLRRYWRPQ